MKTRSHSLSKSVTSEKSKSKNPLSRIVKVQKSRGASRSKSREKNNKKENRCGICGKTEKIFRIECCNNWICDDYEKYAMFSYNTISCHRNHDRYTLCGYHFHEEHKGNWQNCDKCRSDINTEIYVWYGTNEHNFEKLKNVPKYEPTKCSKCQRMITLGTEPHSVLGDEYTCFHCLAQEGKLF